MLTEVLKVWKTPHGIPHMNSPKARTERDGAKNGMTEAGVDALLVNQLC
jgi:hypothetical protein